MRTLISNARIVNRQKCFTGSVLIQDGYIESLMADGKGPCCPVDQEIDATGLYLLPGVIDDHVHFREPGFTRKAGIDSESRAAAAGGVTSFMDMPNTLPQTVTLEAWEEKYALGALKSSVNFAFYMGATNSNSDLIASLDPARVCGVKVFMGASTGDMLVDRRDTLRHIFSTARIPIAVHCEDSALIAENTRRYKAMGYEDPSVSCHPLIRSAQACYQSSSEAVELARETGARLHILHISTARELELLSRAPLGEKRITAEVTPTHLHFCDKDYARLGARIKCNPAVKSEADRTALWEALRDGRIDVIGTDHAPHLPAEKEGGAFTAASGVPSIQFSLLLMLEAVTQGKITLEEVVQKMCHAPADLFQVKGRGYLDAGCFADMVLVSPCAPWQLKREDILSRCGWSPFEGEMFHWQVKRTFVNGTTAYEQGHVNEECRGRALQFDRE